MRPYIETLNNAISLFGYQSILENKPANNAYILAIAYAYIIPPDIVRDNIQVIVDKMKAKEARRNQAAQ